MTTPRSGPSPSRPSSRPRWNGSRATRSADGPRRPRDGAGARCGLHGRWHMIRDDEHRDRGPSGVWDDLSSAVLDRGTIDPGLVARAAELPPDRLRWTIDDLFRR